MSEWISVNERMPENEYVWHHPRHRYLVRVQEIHGGRLSDRFRFECCDYYSTREFSNCFHIQDNNGIVTHWMEIPLEGLDG